jgi:hypothetical protein
MTTNSMPGSLLLGDPSLCVLTMVSWCSNLRGRILGEGRGGHVVAVLSI